ncbi:CAP domain-containing protein [Oribacterium sp.]
MAKFLLAISVAFLLSALPSFSVGFTKGSSRDAWWYDLGNENYLRSTWQWIDTDNDGVAECYYFDADGWMYTDTTTPDGYTVDENGAWTVDSVVQTRETQDDNTTEETDTTSGQDGSSYKQETMDRINQFRAGQNLQALAESERLSSIADIRAKECAISFSHTRPQGGSVLDESDVYGEILAHNNETPERTVNAWISSAGHNHIMSKGEFQHFGAGYYMDEKGNDYWVVLFGY